MFLLIGIDASFRSCMGQWGQFNPAMISVAPHSSRKRRHKDYLFQKRLARTLPMDSFRFDFRCVPKEYSLKTVLNLRWCSGHHETGGAWKLANFFGDVEDIQTVVQFLSSELGYTVDLIVAHSKGSVSAMLWLCKYEEAKSVRGFVNVAGRYRMEASA